MFLRESTTSKEGGFTLIELLVTIAIIGTLAAIALPMYSQQQASANRTTAISDGRAALDSLTFMDNPYSALGTTAGTISFLGPVLTMTLGSNPVPATPTSITAVINMSTNGTLVGSIAPNSTKWCFITTSNGQSAAFDQSGYQASKSVCTAGILS